MKNRKIYLISLVLFTSFFMLFSCKNTVSVEQKEDNQKTEIKKLENPVLKFTLQEEPQSERTVRPNIKLNDLTDFVLEGKIVNDSDYSVLATYKNAAEIMSAGYEFKIDQAGQEWSFRLTAKSGDIIYTSIKENVTLKRGENKINFELKQNNLGDASGTGSINVTLNFADAENGENVNYIWAYIDNHFSIDYYNYFWESYSIDSITNGTATFNITDIPVGEYTLSFRFENRDYNIKLLEWTEIVHVTEGHVSSKEIKIDAVNPLYTVTYMLDKDDESPVIKKVSRYADSLDDLYRPQTRTDYLFTGWYTDSACTKLVEFPIKDDITLYAGWISVDQGEGVYVATANTVEDIISNITQGTKEAPAVIKVFGKLNSDSIYKINNALYNNSNVYFRLDYSGAIFYYTEYLYHGETVDNLIEIIFPESVNENFDLFLNCYSSLSKITFEGENPNFYVQDNVVYSKKGELISYLPINTATSFEVPDFVKVIKGYAFYGCNNLTSLTFKKDKKLFYKTMANYINYDNTINLLTNGIRIDDKDSIVSDLLRENVDWYNYDYAYYIVDSEIDMTPIYNNSTKITKFYKTTSMDISDGSYMVVDTEEPYVIYRFDAVIGNEYKINFLNLYSQRYYSNYPESLTDCEIYILNGNGDFIANGYYYYEYEFNFTANTEIIYIIVKQTGIITQELNNTGCSFALRVMDNKNLLSINNSGNVPGIHVNIDTELIPEGAERRQFYLDGERITTYDGRISNPEFAYPYVTAGKTYKLKVEYEGNGAYKSSELSITPTSGLGEYYFENTDYTIINNVLTFKQTPVLKYGDEKVIPTTDTGYALDIGEKYGAYLGWHGWYTYDELNGFDFSKDGIIRESSRDKEIGFNIYYSSDSGYGDKYLYMMYHDEYFTYSN